MDSTQKLPSLSSLKGTSSSLENLVKCLKVRPEKGLSNLEAQNRQNFYGKNVLVSKNKRSLFLLFLSQFSDFMVLVLLGAALISGFLGEVSDTIIIMTILLLNALLGFIQEYRADRAMEALKAMTITQARVLRAGNWIHMDSQELVPGDIIDMEAGNIIPADVRLLESQELKVNEAALTGESEPVSKQRRDLPTAPAENIPLGDQFHCAFKGTFAVHGRGMGMVVATGMNTEMGKIAALLENSGETQTPLQKRLAQLGRQIAVVIMGACFILMGAGILRGENPFTMFLTALSLAVAAIPESLPAVITLSLARGARRMAQKNAVFANFQRWKLLGPLHLFAPTKQEL